MVAAILLCLVMAGGDGAPAAGAPADRQAYESAKSKAGRDANAQVRLALWCEAHGLTTERLEHLALAVALDPRNTLARGLLGLVTYRGQWERPEAVGSELRKDPAYQALIREYLDRRVRTPHQAEAQLRLAAWCSQHGLKEQALAHYQTVVRLDPSREAAWKHLGYTKHGNRWVKPEEAAAERLEAERQKHADLHWKPRLEKLLAGLHSTHAAHRERAQEELAQITDPRAVPMIGHVLARGHEGAQLTAVRVLGQIEGPAASNLLAALAVFSPAAEVRRQAIDTLARRDPRDVVGRLITLIRRPFQYTVRPGNGPGTTGVLVVDGEQFDLRRLYRFPSMDVRLVPTALPGLVMPRGLLPRSPAVGRANLAIAAVDARMAEYNAEQTEMMMMAAMAETIQRTRALEQSLANDIQTIEVVNAQINQVNGRVLPILQALTGQSLGAAPDSWRKWWTDQLGYVYQSPSQPTTKPTYTEMVTMPDVTLSVALPVIPVRTHTSCFAAGTQVQTIDGPRAIESIQVGDRVLSQNTATGALAFQPVVAVHHNEPAATLRLAIDGETIVATGIHRFWKAGKGWTMARALKAGDRLRMIGGVVEIRSIATDATQPVYNLDVAENRNFFVGTKGLLVHDFSFVQPVLAPFDRTPDLAAAPSRAPAGPPAR